MGSVMIKQSGLESWLRSLCFTLAVPLFTQVYNKTGNARHQLTIFFMSLQASLKVTILVTT